MSTDQWKTGTPDVAEGKRETFWCAIKGCNGKLFHRHLDYLNGHIMPLSDTCHDIDPEHAVPVGDDGDYKWTGWHEVSCDQCETQWCFHQEVVAWIRLPRYFAQPVADGPAGFSDAQRMQAIIDGEWNVWWKPVKATVSSTPKYDCVVDTDSDAFRGNDLRAAIDEAIRAARKGV